MYVLLNKTCTCTQHTAKLISSTFCQQYNYQCALADFKVFHIFTNKFTLIDRMHRFKHKENSKRKITKTKYL